MFIQFFHMRTKIDIHLQAGKLYVNTTSQPQDINDPNLLPCTLGQDRSDTIHPHTLTHTAIGIFDM